MSIQQFKSYTYKILSIPNHFDQYPLVIHINATLSMYPYSNPSVPFSVAKAYPGTFWAGGQAHLMLIVNQRFVPP